MSFKNKRQSQIVGISQYAYFSQAFMWILGVVNLHLIRRRPYQLATKQQALIRKLNGLKKESK
jgi:hypothetical protein